MNLFCKKNGNYNEARGILDSHIRFLSNVENLYQKSGKLISFNMLNKIDLYKPMVLDVGVTLHLICKTTYKIGGVVHCEPDSKVNPQWHDVDEKFIIISGSANIQIEEGDAKMKANDVFVVRRGQVHSSYHPERTIYIVEFLKEC